MFKNKKALPLIVSFFALSATLISCGRNEEENNSQEPIDDTKTQLWVKYFNGGLRREWIDNVCDQFEKDYASYSFEQGKTGVQIRKDFEKNSIQVDAVTSSPYQVFVMENTDYYQFASKNTLLDITDVVKGNAPVDASTNESETIESKMYEDSKKFYNLGTEGVPHYYGLPFYTNACSINYNVDLFNEKGFYFAKDKTAEGFSEDDLNSYEKVSELFIGDLDDEKSHGPDGKTGTIDGVDYSWDDGLPATYADFHALMTYMSSEGVTPIAWNGFEKGYLISLALNTYANSIGYEQAKNILTFSGTSTNLLKLDDNYRPVLDNEGNYVYEDDLNVNASNVYKTHQQKGLLDSINFVKTIMGNKKFYLAEGFKGTLMHTTAQNYFINGMDDPSLVPGNQPLGMLVEGSWWNSEATSQYKGNEKMTKKFGIMPTPKPDASKIGEGNTTLSDRDSTMFINSNCPENLQKVAKTFLAYLNSDKSMNTFSRYTDMMRMMDYELSEETLSNMSYYGNQMYKYFHAPTTKHLDWRPQSEEASKKTSALSYRKWGYSIDASNDNPFEFFNKNPNASAVDLFAKINSYYDISWTK